MIDGELSPSSLRLRRRTSIAALAVALVLAMVGSAVVGAADVALGDVWNAVVRRGSVSGVGETIVWSIRIPRILSGAVVGAALAIAGCGLQGTFRNHMADPQLLGISAAAGIGAVGGIAIAPTGQTVWFLVLGASIGGVAAAHGLRMLASRIGGGNQFVLAGLAIGLATLAWLGAIVIVWDSPRVPTFTFWVFGGLSTATWRVLAAGAVGAVVGTALVITSARSLDVMSLGTEAARDSGVAVSSVTTRVMSGVGILTGAAVGIGGVVGLVGLVVPYALRRIVGPHHRWLLILSAIGGALAVVLVDTLARTAAAPAEVPLGLLTGGIGGPLFVWLALRGTDWRP